MKRDVGSSSGLIVAPVRSRAEQKQFLQLPWQLYAGDPNWIPPLLMDHQRAGRVQAPPVLRRRRDSERFWPRATAKSAAAWRPSSTMPTIAGRRKAGLLRLLRVDRRRAGGAAPCSTPPAAGCGRRTWHARARADQSLAQLRVRPAGRGLRFAADLHDDLQQAVLRQAGRGLWLPEGRKTCSPSGATSTCSRSSTRSCGSSPTKPRSGSTSRCGRWTASTFAAKSRCSFASTTHRWSAPGASCRCRPAKSRCSAPGLKHLIAPELAIVAEVDGRADRGLPGPARLQSPHQGHRRPAVPLRLPAPAPQQARDQEDARVQHQRRARVSALGPGRGAVGRSDRADAQIGACRKREFSWVLESNTLSRGSLEKGGAKLDKTYRMYDYDLPK